jgi:drug/metabolite transporter (DMT)-like permease
LRLLLALAGVALVLKTPDTPWPIPSSATDYLALLGGASFALNNTMLRKLADLPESVRMGAMFSGGTLITAAAAVALLPSGQVALPADMSWWPYALGLALCLLFSNLSLQYGAARLAANTTALVMLSEILFATASSVAMGVSELTARKLFGGLLIVFAAVLATMPTSPKEPP